MNHRRGRSVGHGRALERRPARARLSTLARAAMVVLVAAASIAEAPLARAQDAPRDSHRHGSDERIPLLWQVDGPARTLFLYGSIHVAPPEVIPPPVVVREAFNQSSMLITEIVIDEGLERALQAALATRMFTEGDELPDLVAPDIWARIRSWGTENGIAPGMLRTMQPWAVDMIINESATMPPGFSPDHGLDSYFSEKARARGMPTMGLERMEDQLDLLTGGTLEEQLKSLVQTLSEDVRGDETLRLYDAWSRGDVPRLEALVTEGLGTPSDSAYDRLLTRRNRLWVEVLHELLAEAGPPVFVVVGAAHLVGEQSVLRMLAERGHEARRLSSVAGLE